jgi:hypothetical protein
VVHNLPVATTKSLDKLMLYVPGCGSPLLDTNCRVPARYRVVSGACLLFRLLKELFQWGCTQGEPDHSRFSVILPLIVRKIWTYELLGIEGSPIFLVTHRC